MPRTAIIDYSVDIRMEIRELDPDASEESVRKVAEETNAGLEESLNEVLNDPMTGDALVLTAQVTLKNVTIEGSDDNA